MHAERMQLPGSLEYTMPQSLPGTFLALAGAYQEYFLPLLRPARQKWSACQEYFVRLPGPAGCMEAHGAWNGFETTVMNGAL